MPLHSPGRLLRSLPRDLDAIAGQGGRRRRSVLGVLLACASLSVASLADTRPESVSPTRLDRLRAWVDAVEAHIPGRIDPPLSTASRWSRSDLLSLRVDLSVIYLLVDDPSLRRVRFVPSDELRRLLADASPVPLMLAFDEQVLDQMRPVAQRIRAAGPGTIAKRGVLLHTDLVTLGLDNREIVAAPRRNSDRRRIFLDDGRLAAVSHSPVHWDIARFLARQVHGSAAAENWIPGWYRATVAFMQRERQYGSDQLRHALQTASSDAQLLLLAGGEHEALASRPVQAFIHTAVRSARMALPVDSADQELAEAQRFFSRAVDQDPGLVEARVRLGRVLGLRGRSAEAIRHLREASLTSAEPLIAFYAFLFLGSELVTQGDYAGARAAYLQAAERFPQAQSVNLSLAELAWRFGQRDEMEMRMKMALESADDASDPWRTYHAAHGRRAALLLQQVRETALP